MVGITTMYLLNCLVSFGHSVNILRQTQRGCASLFIQSEQGLQEIFHLKYIAMAEADRSEQNIAAQKHIDQVNLDSVKASIMRNYVGVFPSIYQGTMDYSTWTELEDYVNELMKIQKENK